MKPDYAWRVIVLMQFYLIVMINIGIVYLSYRYGLFLLILPITIALLIANILMIKNDWD